MKKNEHNTASSQCTAESLLTFPCRFSIKAIGINDPLLAQGVFDVISQHADDLKHDDITFRHSQGKKYIGITITITATSQQQLDAIYQALTDDARIHFVL